MNPMFSFRCTLAVLISALLHGAAFSEDINRGRIAKAVKAHQEAQKTGICEVHKIKMDSKSVPIHWGEAVPPAPGALSYLYRMEHFPNYLTVIEGGCVKISGKDSETTFICPRCKAEALAWDKNGKK